MIFLFTTVFFYTHNPFILIMQQDISWAFLCVCVLTHCHEGVCWHRVSKSPFLIQCLCLCVCVCVCVCVFKSSIVRVPSPALQLVSLTDPSCNGDISAPVLAGEEEGESGDYLMPSQLSEELWRNASDVFIKHLSVCGEVEPCRVGWPSLAVLLILILSLGQRAGEVIKIVQLGMALA